MASGTASRQSRGPTPLPSYQPPEHPLNETAIRAIQDLPRNHRLDPLKARFKAANSHLTTAAVDANDRLQIQLVAYEKDRARREKQGSQGEHGAEERLMEEARQKTENLTGRLEGSIRKMIDARAEVEGFEHALKELQENVVEGRGHLAPTQSTLGASQFQQNRRAQRAGMDSDSESDDDAAGENGSAIDLMKRKIAEQKAAYQNSSMFHRYAQHNDYVGFKKLVHDAQYPGHEAPPMPHASTWFSSVSPDSSNATTRRGAAAVGSRHADDDDDDDDDDDVAVASERISIKCPITLLQMKDPVTSQKCPHSFEKTAILEMIDHSDVFVGRSGLRGARDGQKAMKCPVCEMLLTADDLKEDPVLVRKIQRIQAANNAQDEDSDEDDDGRRETGKRPEEISSSPAPRTRTPMVKYERQSQIKRDQSRQVSMVPNTQLQDLVDEDQGRPSSSAMTDVVDLEDMDEDMEG